MCASSVDEKGSAKAAGADTKSDTKTSSGPTPKPLVVGQFVRWWHNGWRHGMLVKVGPKWAHVRYVNHIKRLPVSEVEAETIWPHP